MGTIQLIALTFSIASSFFKVLSKAKDPDFKYIDILNSQLQSFQLKFTERLENRLSSKTIKVLLSNRKLTGRKRIAFDNNVYKIAILSDELENVKQLNFSLQKFESNNIEFEKKCSDLHNSLQEEICLKGVLLAKNQNLSNQLDSLKDTNSCLINYVKSINKKVGTAIVEKFSEITENNKSRKIKEFKSKAETALWFVESYGLVPQYLKLESTDGQTVKVDFNPSSSKSSYQDLPEEERQKIKYLLFILEKFNVRELTVFCDGLPRTYLVSSMPGRY